MKRLKRLKRTVNCEDGNLASGRPLVAFVHARHHNQRVAFIEFRVLCKLPVVRLHVVFVFDAHRIIGIPYLPKYRNIVDKHALLKPFHVTYNQLSIF